MEYTTFYWSKYTHKYNQENHLQVHTLGINLKLILTATMYTPSIYYVPAMYIYMLSYPMWFYIWQFVTTEQYGNFEILDEN